MRRALVTVAGALLAGVVGARDARACGGELTGPVYVNARNPDLPLTGFAGGHLGVIPQGSWRRGLMVVAYRALTDEPLSDDERAAFTRYEARANPTVDPRVIDPALSRPAGEPGEYASDDEAWRAARAEVVGDRGPEISNGWESRYAWTPNCYEDAFRTAAESLRARASHYGATSPVVRAWVAAQDQVFAACGPQPPNAPDELSRSAPVEQRRDRDYQIAASHFYAGRYDLAERAFRAIAADAGSPWASISRYLVVRTLARAAQRGRDTPDRATLDRASREASAVLADDALSALHDPMRRYVGWLDGVRDPVTRAHTLGVALARGGAGATFDASLHDYDLMLDSRAADAFARQPGDPDRLTTWLAVVENRRQSLGAAPLDVALPLYRSTRARAWLVAALLSDGAVTDARIEPTLTAAAALPPDDPAYATAQYHRLRITAARGRPVYDEAARALATLSGEGRNVRNLFHELMVAHAPDIERLMAVAHGLPAGEDEAQGLILPTAAERAEALSPAAAHLLSQRVPLSVLLRAGRVRGLPQPIVDQVVTVALARAALFDDDGAFLAALALARRASAEARATLRPLMEAPRAERTLALLRATPAVSFATPVIDGGDSTGDLWMNRCDRAPDAVQPAPFLTAAERTEWTRERARWTALGDGPTWMAREAARVAREHPATPGMAEVLAGAVRETRNNGCPRGASVHAASRAAFQALHGLYPRSPEAAATRYWY